MVVGCYHAKNGDFTVNPYCEQELTSETEKELQDKYEKGIQLFEQRINASTKLNEVKESQDEKDATEEGVEFTMNGWD